MIPAPSPKPIVWRLSALVAVLSAALALPAFAKITRPDVWEGTFYEDDAPQRKFATARASEVDFDWSQRPPGGRERFAARWRTMLDLDRARGVVFSLDCDDSCALSVDGVTQVGDRTTHGHSIWQEEMRLPAGRHSIEVTHRQFGGDAFLHVGIEVKGRFSANGFLLFPPSALSADLGAPRVATSRRP